MRSGPYRAICRQNNSAADAPPAPVTSTTFAVNGLCDPHFVHLHRRAAKQVFGPDVAHLVDAATRQQFGTARHRQDRQTGLGGQVEARRRSGLVAAGMATMRWVAPCSSAKRGASVRVPSTGKPATGHGVWRGRRQGTDHHPAGAVLDAGHQQRPASLAPMTSARRCSWLLPLIRLRVHASLRGEFHADHGQQHQA